LSKYAVKGLGELIIGHPSPNHTVTADRLRRRGFGSR
jgi:hypothetical protein